MNYIPFFSSLSGFSLAQLLHKWSEQFWFLVREKNRRTRVKTPRGRVETDWLTEVQFSFL